MKNYLIAALCSSVFAISACSSEKGEGEETTAPVSSNEEVSAGAPAAEKLTMYAFDCGRIDMLDLSIFSSDGEYAEGAEHSAADMCFLIRHPKGDLMWDSGLPDSIHEDADGVTNGPFHISVPVTLTSQLEAIGLKPSDIELFSISHSHFDHVGNAVMFAGSTFLVDKDERDHMFSDDARAAETFGLVAPLENAQTIEFDGDYDVFGDGSVIIKAMPGHTPGHTSLLVNLPESGPVLLSGDMYHLLRAREERIVPTFNTDKEQTLESMDAFEALAIETGAEVIIQHSMEHLEAMPEGRVWN
ncbi:MAG: MBL fold metallo-hydrolase [Hyphococcus sp.]|nr:MAG: MBL fold metallo-hydrolase [Marinicaulis sp.]